MYAKRKNWPLENVKVHTSYSKSHAEDCENCESEQSKIDLFQRLVELSGPLDQKQRHRFIEIANKCPVHRTLHGNIRVITKLVE
jgi:putative redox protein